VNPIIPVFHYSNILAGVKRALEWSKIIFGERNGFWATARQAAKSEFFRDLKGEVEGRRVGI
jgi:hypothetical protein